MHSAGLPPSALLREAAPKPPVRRARLRPALLGGRAQTTHEKQMEMYLSSRFCLMLPGDSQTSRRLPEAVMAGCVPVFLGPPFHSMPLVHQARPAPASAPR